MKSSSRDLVLSSLFLAFGLLLPFVTAQMPSIGNKLLPMHIPVLLCGFLLGGKYGLIVGFITPLLRSLLFTMPPMFPIAIAMAFELATYGLIAGILYKLFPKKTLYIYISLIISMICGRIVWGIVSSVLYGVSEIGFTWEIFIAGGFINAIPGIIIQIIIIPVIVIAVKREKLIGNV